MLALGIDFLVAYLLTRKLRNVWLLVVLAILAGTVSTIIANLVMYLLASNTFTPGEIVVRIASGLIWHPLITIVAVFVLRKRQNNKNTTPIEASTPKVEESDNSTDEITEFVQFLSSSPSETDVAEKTSILLASGYDAESLMDIVRERAGIKEAEHIKRFIETHA